MQIDILEALKTIRTAENSNIRKTFKEKEGKIQIPTCHNAVCDGCSLLVAVHNGLDTVGVLHPRSQAGYVNTAGVRGHVSWGLSTLTGSHSQLKYMCGGEASAGRRTEATGHKG